MLGSPVGRDAQVLGAVVLEVPTTAAAARRRATGWPAGAGRAGVLVLTAVGVVGPFVRWILRPVHDLDAAALQLAEGNLATRVPALAGPPELRHLARSFNQMADNVETSQAQQRDLIADASHQLGNPLTALRLRLENLRATAASDGRGARRGRPGPRGGRPAELDRRLAARPQPGRRPRGAVAAPLDVAALARHRARCGRRSFADRASRRTGRRADRPGRPRASSTWCSTRCSTTRRSSRRTRRWRWACRRSATRRC